MVRQHAATLLERGIRISVLAQDTMTTNRDTMNCASIFDLMDRLEATSRFDAGCKAVQRGWLQG